MIASHVTDVERMEWSYDDVARELEDLATDDVEGFELETAARPGFEDETADDEIGRASEEWQSDEG
jgi:hypothetical protein